MHLTQKVEGFFGRVVGRSNNGANANGGLVYANANNVSSNSNTNYGSRLANSFRNSRKNRPYGISSRVWGRAASEKPEPQQQRARLVSGVYGKLENVMKWAEVGRFILEGLRPAKIEGAYP